MLVGRQWGQRKKISTREPAVQATSSKPPMLQNEAARLEALRQYRILDTQAERIFDELTELASIICCCPMAQISLVDEHRQWFKSKVGFDISETDRDASFCTFTIAEAEMMVVKDATRDHRFRSNPMVVNEPHICFYAGVPLITPEGHALGALCVMDDRPRDLNFAQGMALRTLARQVVTILELRRTSANLAKAARQIKTLQGLLPICAHCKKIRNEDGTWCLLEEYISSHSQASFTHGICPNCTTRYFPDIAESRTRG